MITRRFLEPVGEEAPLPELEAPDIAGASIESQRLAGDFEVTRRMR